MANFQKRFDINGPTDKLFEAFVNYSVLEDIYYNSAYSYRLQPHLGNRRIDPKFRKMKWHLLMAIKYLVAGESISGITSAKIRNVCEKIDRFIGTNDEEAISKLRRLCESFEPVEEITRDTLKGQRFGATARSNALEVRKQTHER